MKPTKKDIERAQLLMIHWQASASSGLEKSLPKLIAEEFTLIRDEEQQKCKKALGELARRTK